MADQSDRLPTALADRYSIERPWLKPRLGWIVTQVIFARRRRLRDRCRAASALVVSHGEGGMATRRMRARHAD